MLVPGKCWRTNLVQERKDKCYIIANDRGLLISRKKWTSDQPTLNKLCIVIMTFLIVPMTVQ